MQRWMRGVAQMVQSNHLITPHDMMMATAFDDEDDSGEFDRGSHVSHSGSAVAAWHGASPAHEGSLLNAVSALAHETQEKREQQAETSTITLRPDESTLLETRSIATSTHQQQQQLHRVSTPIVQSLTVPPPATSAANMSEITNSADAARAIALALNPELASLLPFDLLLAKFHECNARLRARGIGVIPTVRSYDGLRPTKDALLSPELCTTGRACDPPIRTAAAALTRFVTDESIVDQPSRTGGEAESVMRIIENEIVTWFRPWRKEFHDARTLAISDTIAQMPVSTLRNKSSFIRTRSRQGRGAADYRQQLLQQERALKSQKESAEDAANKAKTRLRKNMAFMFDPMCEVLRDLWRRYHVPIVDRSQFEQWNMRSVSKLNLWVVSREIALFFSVCGTATDDLIQLMNARRSVLERLAEIARQPIFALAETAWRELDEAYAGCVQGARSPPRLRGAGATTTTTAAGIGGGGGGGTAQQIDFHELEQLGLEFLALVLALRRLSSSVIEVLVESNSMPYTGPRIKLRELEDNYIGGLRTDTIAALADTPLMRLLALQHPIERRQKKSSISINGNNSVSDHNKNSGVEDENEKPFSERCADATERLFKDRAVLLTDENMFLLPMLPNKRCSHEATEGVKAQIAKRHREQRAQARAAEERAKENQFQQQQQQQQSASASVCLDEYLDAKNNNNNKNNQINSNSNNIGKPAAGAPLSLLRQPQPQWRRPGGVSFDLVSLASSRDGGAAASGDLATSQFASFRRSDAPTSVVTAGSTTPVHGNNSVPVANYNGNINNGTTALMMTAGTNGANNSSNNNVIVLDPELVERARVLLASEEANRIARGPPKQGTIPLSRSSHTAALLKRKNPALSVSEHSRALYASPQQPRGLTPLPGGRTPNPDPSALPMNIPRGHPSTATHDVLYIYPHCRKNLRTTTGVGCWGSRGGSRRGSLASASSSAAGAVAGVDDLDDYDEATIRVGAAGEGGKYEISLRVVTKEDLDPLEKIERERELSLEQILNSNYAGNGPGGFLAKTERVRMILLQTGSGGLRREFHLDVPREVARTKNLTRRQLQLYAAAARQVIESLATHPAYSLEWKTSAEENALLKRPRKEHFEKLERDRQHKLKMEERANNLRAMMLSLDHARKEKVGGAGVDDNHGNDNDDGEGSSKMTAPPYQYPLAIMAEEAGARDPKAEALSRISPLEEFVLRLRRSLDPDIVSKTLTITDADTCHPRVRAVLNIKIPPFYSHRNINNKTNIQNRKSAGFDIAEIMQAPLFDFTKDHGNLTFRPIAREKVLTSQQLQQSLEKFVSLRRERMLRMACKKVARGCKRKYASNTVLGAMADVLRKERAAHLRALAAAQDDDTGEEGFIQWLVQHGAIDPRDATTAELLHKTFCNTWDEAAVACATSLKQSSTVDPSKEVEASTTAAPSYSLLSPQQQQQRQHHHHHHHHHPYIDHSAATTASDVFGCAPIVCQDAVESTDEMWRNPKGVRRITEESVALAAAAAAAHRASSPSGGAQGRIVAPDVEVQSTWPRHMMPRKDGESFLFS